jgi:hypothetical protein
VGGQGHAPAALPPGKEALYPLYRRLGGPQSRSGRVWKNSPATGIGSPDHQPVASRYTDWTNLAPVLGYSVSKPKARNLRRVTLKMEATTSFETLRISY